jgi:ribosomal protein L16 Arg81 hydroxylase
MKFLEQLLAPCPAVEFLENYWTQRAIHIKSNSPERFQSFFSWNELNTLLNYHCLAEPDLHFSLNGKSLPETDNPENWNDYLKKGATLIIDGMQKRVPAIAQLAARLRQEIGYRTHVNLYFSPTAQQGFNCHYDNHDVLILQIEGEKEWFIFSETQPYPTQRHSDTLTPPETPPYLQCTLKAGEMLYIPRGHWHYAIAAQDSPSLHLTVGIDCQTGLDWLAGLIKEAEQYQQWRQSIPLVHGADQTAAKTHLQQLQQHLVEQLLQPDAITKYLDSLVVCDHPPMVVNLPSQLGHQLFENLFETRYAWSPFHTVQVTALDDITCQLCAGTKQITLKYTSPDLISALIRKKSFTLLDIADIAPEMDLEADIVPLMTCLVTEGVLLHSSPSAS